MLKITLPLHTQNTELNIQIMYQDWKKNKKGKTVKEKDSQEIEI